MLQALQQDPELKVQSWDQVERIDIRPKKGLAKLTLETGLEVQLDTSNGKILQKAVRRSDLIEALHDGSFFAGDYTKLGLFLPAAVALFLMLLTGLWLWWLPIKVRRAKRKRANQS
jgi:antitoxin component of MazEF toxin-antitoxin module